MTEESMEALCNAIVKQAADDYRRAFWGYGIGQKSAVSVKRECKTFFLSEWYKLLTKLDGGILMNMLEADELERMIQFYDMFLSCCTSESVTLKYKKHGKDEKVQTLTVPPRLMDDFRKVIQKQKEELESKLQEVKNE